MKKVYLLALIAAILAGALVYLYLGQSTKIVSQSFEMQKVVVASKDIPAYTDITDDMVTTLEMPKMSVPNGATDNKDDVVGKRCASAIVPGQMILTTMVGSPDQVVSSLSTALDDGHYAMSFAFNIPSSVAGYIVPGDHVNVYGVELNENKEIVGSILLAEDVEVLHTGTAASPDGKEYEDLTLSLTKDQCGKLYAYEAAHPNSTNERMYIALCRRVDQSQAQAAQTNAQQTGEQAAAKTAQTDAQAASEEKQEEASE